MSNAGFYTANLTKDRSGTSFQISIISWANVLSKNKACLALGINKERLTVGSQLNDSQVRESKIQPSG
jgi:hypothetical protein